MSVLIGWFIVIVMSMVWLVILFCVADHGWKDTALFLGGMSIIISNFLLIGLVLINGGTL